MNEINEKSSRLRISCTLRLQIFQGVGVEQFTKEQQTFPLQLIQSVPRHRPTLPPSHTDY
jgi:hypothetical protein